MAPVPPRRRQLRDAGSKSMAGPWEARARCGRRVAAGCAVGPARTPAPRTTATAFSSGDCRCPRSEIAYKLKARPWGSGAAIALALAVAYYFSRPQRVFQCDFHTTSPLLFSSRDVARRALSAPRSRCAAQCCVAASPLRAGGRAAPLSMASCSVALRCSLVGATTGCFYFWVLMVLAAVVGDATGCGRARPFCFLDHCGVMTLARIAIGGWASFLHPAGPQAYTYSKVCADARPWWPTWAAALKTSLCGQRRSSAAI